MSKRLVTEAQAATVMRIELATFRHLVAIGRLPKPLPDLDRYDMKAIHAALYRMSGIGCASNELDKWLERRNAR